MGKSEAVKAGKRRSGDEAFRVLQTMNKQLLARVKALELARIGGAAQDGGTGKAGDYEESEESGHFTSMVKDLHGDIDAAYVLKKALEADLTATQQKLSEEEAVRAELEARANMLEGKAALADELREDISFVEEEQNKTFRRLKEVTSELEQVSSQRDGLVEQRDRYAERLKELQTQRFDLEAQVLDLRERLAEMVSLFGPKQAPSS